MLPPARNVVIIRITGIERFIDFNQNRGVTRQVEILLTFFMSQTP